MTIRRSLASLGDKNFRCLWLGCLLSSLGFWMDMVALSWVILVLTDSPFYVGLVNFCRWLPFLFVGPLGGVVSDSADRRHLLMGALAINAAVAVVLTGLLYMDQHSVQVILVLTLTTGIAMSISLPTRQALIGGLVRPEFLLNAVSLYAAAFSLSRLLGPVVAGIVIASFGAAALYALQALLYCLAFLAIRAIPPVRGERQPRGSLWTSFFDGLAYARGNALVVVVIVAGFVSMLLGIPASTLLPVFARDVFQIGVTGLGWLTSAQGVGAVAGAMLLASVGDLRSQGLVLMISHFTYALTVMVFSMSSSLGFPLAVLALQGLAGVVFMSLSNSLLQLNVPDRYRGRVLSLQMLENALIPFGSLFVGSLALLAGPRQALLMLGGLHAGMLVAVMVLLPLRQALSGLKSSRSR